jgi:tetratricopeptide (TPR) repeat protein
VDEQRATASAVNKAIGAFLRTAETFHQNGRLREAERLYREVLSSSPTRAESVETHFKLGQVLRERGMSDAAIAHYEKAIALKPDDAHIYSNLGRLLGELGRLAQARVAFEKAVVLLPRCGAAYLNLVHCDKVSADDPYLAEMQKLERDQGALGEQDRIDLDFALGKAYADIGEHERSFRHLLRANTRKRKTLAYDEAAMLSDLERIRLVFDEKLMRAAKRRGNPSYLPVFIVGMPRSGTTLIEQMLASHPKVFGAGELTTFHNAVRELAEPGGASLPFPELLLGLSKHRLRALGDRYLAAVKALAPAVARITDKMPGNFRYTGLIHLALPNARIIHARRDPIDTCMSCFSYQFTAGGGEYSYDLGELGRCYRAYEELMTHWRNVVASGVMIDVQYEDLVQNPEREARRMVVHCGLDWDERCLDFQATQRPVRTASAAQVRQPLYRSSIGRWRPDEAVLRPLLDGLRPIADPSRALAGRL